MAIYIWLYIMGQTVKRKEVTFVVLNWRKKLPESLRESEKMAGLNLHEFHKNTFTNDLQLLALNFTEYRLRPKA